MSIISVEGNIGAGKSTLLCDLETVGFRVLAEPVTTWREEGLLKRFYANPKETAFEFQMAALRSRAAQMAAAVAQNELVVLERSLWADKNIFAT